MTEVLLAVERAEETGPLLDVAGPLAAALGAEVHRVSLSAELPAEERAAELLADLAGPEVSMAVLAGHDGEDATFWKVIDRAAKPVVLVPEGAHVRGALDRVLLPLDGTQVSAATVARTAEVLGCVGVDLVVLHVFDARTAPRFWDQAAHARAAWDREFLVRNLEPDCARLELRTGTPGERVVDVADQEEADLVVLGWSQRLQPGRAATVRHTLLETHVPLMLVPVSAHEMNSVPGT